MGDLDASPLFDSRHLQCVQAVLQGRPLNPLSRIEQAFITWGPSLKTINEDLYERKLVERLSKYQHYVATADAVQFLVEAHKRKVGAEARDILEATVTEQRGGTVRDLVRILQESRTGIPAEWAVTVYGETTADRHAPPPPPSSGLNLEAMRNFH